jgi:hypothetical protein
MIWAVTRIRGKRRAERLPVVARVLEERDWAAPAFMERAVAMAGPRPKRSPVTRETPRVKRRTGASGMGLSGEFSALGDEGDEGAGGGEGESQA